jgi:hypothetical protein
MMMMMMIMITIPSRSMHRQGSDRGVLAEGINPPQHPPLRPCYHPPRCQLHHTLLQRYASVSVSVIVFVFVFLSACLPVSLLSNFVMLLAFSPPSSSSPSSFLLPPSSFLLPPSSFLLPPSVRPSRVLSRGVPLQQRSSRYTRFCSLCRLVRLVCVCVFVCVCVYVCVSVCLFVMNSWVCTCVKERGRVTYVVSEILILFVHVCVCVRFVSFVHQNGIEPPSLMHLLSRILP